MKSNMTSRTNSNSGTNNRVKQKDRTFYIVFGSLILDLLAFTVILPLLPSLMDYYSHNDQVGITASYVIWALSNNFLLFVIARIVGGISKGNVSLCTAIVTDVSTPKERGKGMALIGVAFSIGFVFGPSIGAAFSHFNRQGGNDSLSMYPALFSFILASADLAFMFLMFKETHPKEKRLQTNIVSNTVDYINPISLFKFSSVQRLSSKDSSQVRSIGTIYFTYLFIYSGLEFTLPFLMHNRFEYSSMQQGKMFFFLGTIMALVQGGYTRRIPSGKEVKIASQGIIVLIAAFVVMAFATNIMLMYVGLTFFSFASATVVPCMTTLISTYGGEDEKGTILGIFRSIGALSRAVGPLILSTVYWSFGAHICFSIGAAALALPLMKLLREFKTKSA